MVLLSLDNLSSYIVLWLVCDSWAEWCYEVSLHLAIEPIVPRYTPGILQSLYWHLIMWPPQILSWYWAEAVIPDTRSLLAAVTRQTENEHHTYHHTTQIWETLMNTSAGCADFTKGIVACKRKKQAWQNILELSAMITFTPQLVYTRMSLKSGLLTVSVASPIACESVKC